MNTADFLAGEPQPVRALAGRDKRVWEWLVSAGICVNQDKTRRVVIDIKCDDMVRVYVERIGDSRMMSVTPPDLTEAVVEWSSPDDGA